MVKSFPLLRMAAGVMQALKCNSRYIILLMPLRPNAIVQSVWQYEARFNERNSKPYLVILPRVLVKPFHRL